MKVAAALLCMTALVAVVLASEGFDISGATCDGSSWVSATQFPCFASKGKTFTIIQAWQGGHGATNSIAYCAKQAHAAGLQVSLYAYACPRCTGNTPAYSTFYNLVKNLAKQGVSYTYLYFDIEECPPQQCWETSTQQNANFLGDAVAGAEAAGAKVGIYASSSQWSQLMGSNTSFKNLPLWYAHYDASPSFSDFKSFGGWTKPHMKQYNDHSDVGCFSNVDVDYM
jgi:GH25 family lysozyme M1 (1,4-beta-N-acetylmuramidase)